MIANKHLYIAVAIIVAVLGLGILGVLWLRAHDAEIRAEQQTASASVDVRIQQQTIEKLAESMKEISLQQQADRQANDAKFDSMKTVMQQAVNMATVMGMKQQPTVIQPGTNPELPRGGLYLNPEQVQEAHNYEKVCEDCKIENTGLHKNIDALTGTITAKDKQLEDNKVLIANLNKDLRRGFRYRLEDCATRAAIGGASGAIGAAMTAPTPLQSKPVGKAAAIGAGLGVFSCLIKR